jgi:membrane-associated phospholipid phosphatase
VGDLGTGVFGTGAFVHHHFSFRAAALALACLAPLWAAPAQAQDFTTEPRIATAVQLALPALAGICAARQGRTGDFLAGFAAETLTVQGLKHGLGDVPLNRRPNGGPYGFPSGHAALAMYGATSLARKCAPDRPLIAALAYGAALAVAISRVHSRNHNAGQVLSGLAIGHFANGVSLGVGPRGGLALGFSMSF